MSDPLTTAAGILATLKSSMAVIVAGILGATLSLRFASQSLSVWEKITTVGSGATLAHFLASPTSNYFDLTLYNETIGFLIGLFGLSLCAAIIDAMKKLDLANIIRKKLGV
jgi:hypothetical protein